ncbi:MAG: DNA-processing protein DprA [Spirochaetales bacterium]|nr:DNA-processing protein DprA [Spirochaetales bacterium]
MSEDKDLWGNIISISDRRVVLPEAEERVYDMALSFEEGITPLEKMALFRRYGSSKAILELGKTTLQNLLGRGWQGVGFDPTESVKKALDMQYFIENAHIKTMRFDDPDYPVGLAQIPDCPFLLYYKGSFQYNYYTSIGFVGTRHPTESGVRLAKDYGDYFASQGFTIVSGLAAGVDSIGHNCAVEANIPTIAVMGCGIDRIYPADNKDLAKRILDGGGAIVSEYAPGAGTQKWRFPRRNRIIVGLSRSVFLAQAAQRSGSLITAYLTTDYNRDLFIAPPPESEDEFVGNRRLIEIGAACLHSPQEIHTHWQYTGDNNGS